MGRRVSWWDIPEHVRSAIETALGSPVVEAETQQGGYSPGTATRVRLRNGGRAFVKALSVDLHHSSFGMYRQEAAVMSQLPAGLPVPRLLDVYDDGQWVALVFEDIDGRHPEIPWRSDELDRVVQAIGELSASLDPSPWPEAPTFAEVNAGVLRASRAFMESPPANLDPLVRWILDELASDGIDLAEVSAGDALLHNDIRSDNILLTPDGRVVFIDWGMPCHGAVWQDLMMFAFTMASEGGVDPDLMLRTHPLTHGISPSAIDLMVLAGYAAYRAMAEGPVDPLMPDAKAYQIACADASHRWLQRRAARRRYGGTTAAQG